jgi:hypothetical protein
MKKHQTITKESGRYFLKDMIREEVNFWNTAQSHGEPPPPAQKPALPDSRIISQPDRATWSIPPSMIARPYT